MCGHRFKRSKKGIVMLSKAIRNLLVAQTGATWLREVEKNIIPKEIMCRYGLKGSPKLSKQLVKLGIAEDKVSMILSASTKGSTLCKVWKSGDSIEVVRLQGNSTYFNSCQAVTNAGDGWEGGEQCQVKQDVEPYVAGDLIFITEGDLGDLIARVKVRVLKNNLGELSGLFLERPYGRSTNLLVAARQLALEMKVPLYGTANYWKGENCELISFKSPSTNFGYVDSRDWKINAVVIASDDNYLLREAYKTRAFIGNCYTLPLAEINFNPQNNKFLVADFYSRKNLRKAIKQLLPLLPKDPGTEFYGSWKTWNFDDHSFVELQTDGEEIILLRSGVITVTYRNNTLTVMADCKSLNLQKAQDLP
jgi:hypothetical protein